MTRTTKLLDPKDVAESDVITFDFTSQAEAGETIASPPSVACEVYSGADSSPSSFLSGAGQIVGLTILQKVTAGVQDAQYHIRCVVTMSTGRILTLSCLIPVIRL